MANAVKEKKKKSGVKTLIIVLVIIKIILKIPKKDRFNVVRLTNIDRYGNIMTRFLNFKFTI